MLSIYTKLLSLINKKLTDKHDTKKINSSNVDIILGDKETQNNNKLPFVPQPQPERRP